MPATRPLLCALFLGLLAGSSAQAAPKKSAKPAVPTAPAACDDFYANTNFAWLQAHPLAPGTASFSRWDELNTTAERQTRDLLTRTTATSSRSASMLLADLVASASTTPALDAGVRATAQPLLARIDAMKKPRELLAVIAALHLAGVPALFSFEALRDAQTGRPRVWILPGGLGLPDPGYYTSTAPELLKAVGLYRASQVELLKFAGLPADQAQKQADLAFGTELALAAAMGAPMVDAGTPADMAKRYPNLKLLEFLQAQGRGVPPDALSVQQPAWFTAVDTMLAKPNLPQWQAYLRMQVMQAVAPAMANDPRSGWMQSLAVLVPGASPTALERLNGLARTEGADLVSAAYAESYATPATLQRAASIGEAIRAAMGRAIDRATWLSPDGKQASRTRLAAMQLAIGKPVEAIDFTGLRFDRGNYAANLLALRNWNRARAMARVTSTIWPWPASQATPTIGYQPGQNQLLVTAAALQAPAFEARSTASDFGSFGALLAQQVSLAFADYTEADGRELGARQQPLVAQYNAYTAGVSPVNGTRMLRQNAADLAAIEIAYDAYTTQGPADPVSTQEFFRAWASVWARQDNPMALDAAQSTSAFAPARWRVNGPLSNSPAFATAFSCKAGKKMVRPAAEQASIWR